jgi:crotonobetaine/carnitine-CoA ligase
VRRCGENVAAAEVEEVLRAHPKIRDAAVISVPDDIRGEEVKAYVLLAEGFAADDLPPDEIVAHCADRLAAFKVPRYVEYRDADFPRTPTMRVRKEELKTAPDLTLNAWDRERGTRPRRVAAPASTKR